MYNIKRNRYLLYALLIYSSISFQGCSNNLSPAGLIHSPNSNMACSGVYIGNGYILTNDHVIDKFTNKNELFLLPTEDFFFKSVDIPIERVLYRNRDTQLALVKLTKTVESSHDFFKICLSRTPIRIGDILTVISSPYGHYPPISAFIVVIDDQPLMRLDPDPRIPTSERYPATTIIGILSKDKARGIGPGSSGGAVLNTRGELVGLVWTGHFLKNGDHEVWITPVSAWIDQLNSDNINNENKRTFYNMFCD